MRLVVVVTLLGGCSLYFSEPSPPDLPPDAAPLPPPHDVGSGFEPAHTLLSQEATTVTLADVDGDGWLDIVARDSESATAFIYRNERDRTFSLGDAFDTGARHGNLAFGDVDGDGIADVVAADGDAAGIVVRLGSAGGAFGVAIPWAMLPSAAPGTEIVALADVDRDGHVDAIVAPRSADAIAVARNHGDGTFESAIAYATPPIGSTASHPTSLVAADLDGDGAPELLVANANTIDVFHNRGDGTFEPGRALAAWSLAPSDNPCSLVARDFDRDGAIDVAVTGLDGTSLFLNDGTGVLAYRQSIVGLDMIGAGDVDGDGLVDLVGTTQYGDQLTMVRGDRPHLDVPVQFPAVAGVSMAVDDLDRDGRADVVIASPMFREGVTVLFAR